MFGVSSFAAYGHGQWLSDGDQRSSEQSHQRLGNHQFRGERQTVNHNKGAQKEVIVAAARLLIWGLTEVSFRFSFSFSHQLDCCLLK